MHTYYENSDIDFKIRKRAITHKGPHVIDAIELVLISKGQVALGIGTELFPSGEGDLCVIFPDLIRHCQVFSKEQARGIYCIASPDIVPAFLKIFQTKAPVCPVIKKADVHPDITHAMRVLLAEGEKAAPELTRGYFEVILSRVFERLPLTEKEAFISDDIIDRVVSYIAKNFQEELSLTKMAADLYVSPYAISRVFSSTFHTNFNGYLNHARLEYAARLLSSSDITVTEAWAEAGFESQRTFNRVFKEAYHMTPIEFKKQAEENREKASEASDEEEG